LCAAAPRIAGIARYVNALTESGVFVTVGTNSTEAASMISNKDLSKLQRVRGAGLFAIIPLLDHVVAIIDSRIQTTAFNAEQLLKR
jgi:hypothetical protein